jgi:hypothetical protein
MENSVHSAIGAALAIEAAKLNILCANIEFGNKIYILRTLIDISSGFDNKKDLQKTLVALAEYAKVRNMIAHHQFEHAPSSDGVRFVVVKARGKYDEPEEIWSPDRFKTERDEVARYQSVLDRIKASFDAKPLPPTDYARALRPHYYGGGGDWDEMYAPRSRSISPALWNHLSPQAQAPPDSDPPSPGTSPQTPEEPRE